MLRNESVNMIYFFSGLLEMSNADFKANISYYQMAKVQMDVSNKLISSQKELLQEALRLVGN